MKSLSFAIIFFLLFIPLASANVCITQTGNCYNSISEAIQDSSEYQEIILVSNIIYSENINLNKTGLILTTNLTSKPVILGVSPILISSENVSIIDISVYGTQTAVTINSSNATIDGLNISSSGAQGSFGIYVPPGNIQGAQIKNNVIRTLGSSGENNAIRLNGQSHTIQNNYINTTKADGNFNIGIHSTATNIRLLENTIYTGGNIDNYGIYLSSNTWNNSIIGNRIITNGSANNHGIYLESTSNWTNISQNTIIASGLSSFNTGIYLSDTLGNYISSNIISTFGTEDNYGVYIESNSHNTSLIGNNISTYGTAGNNIGIIISGSDESKIISNNVTGGGSNAGFGIYFYSSQNTVINKNYYWDTTGSGNHGIYGEILSVNATISDNTIITDTNSSYALRLMAVNDSVVANNTFKATGNKSFGISLEDYESSNPTGNLFYNNIINTTHTPINISSNLYLNNFSTIIHVGLNKVKGSYIGGNFYDNSSGARNTYPYSCTDINADEICDTKLVFNQNNIDYYPLKSALKSGCTEINTPGIHELDKNLTSGASCITLATDDIVLDCKNFTIHYSINTTGFGIVANNNTNITINNCAFIKTNQSIENSAAIILNRTSNAHIGGLNINTTGDNSYGIWLVDTTYVNISNIISNSTGNYSYGFRFDSSSYINATQSYLKTRGGRNSFGIYASDLNFSRIMQNNISTNGTYLNNYGMYFEYSISNVIESNNLSTDGDGETLGSFSHAISLSDSHTNQLVDNKISTEGTKHSNYGIYLSQSNNNTISNNTIKTNGSSDNYGVYLTSSQNSTINLNSILASGRGGSNLGIYIESGSDSANISGNAIMTGGTGYNYAIYIYGSKYQIIDSNIINPNGTEEENHGLFLDSQSDASRLSNNNISILSRVSHGLYILASNNNTITHNRINIWLNDSNAIKIEHSGGNYPTNNTIYNNILNASGSPVLISSPLGQNYFSITPVVEVNIVGGPKIGGNYYDNITGDESLSRSCASSEGICLSSYAILVNNTDFFPLAYFQQIQSTETTSDSSSSSASSAPVASGGAFVCKEKNVCSSWSKCKDGYQYRDCTEACSNKLTEEKRWCGQANDMIPSQPQHRKALFDISVDVIQNVAGIIGPVARVSLVNFGVGGVNVLLDFSVYDTKKNLVLHTTKTIYVETQEEFLEKIGTLPEGEYTLRVEITYPGQTERAVTESKFIVRDDFFPLNLFVISSVVAILLLSISYVTYSRRKTPEKILYQLALSRYDDMQSAFISKNIDKAKEAYTSIASYYNSLTVEHRKTISNMVNNIFRRK